MVDKFKISRHINIANIMTSISITIGIISVVIIIKGSMKIGLTLYSSTFLIDKIDGMIARKFNVVSEFGGELDSLSDAVLFCIIPPIIAYIMGFISWFGIIFIIVYILCGIWRLAHYNVTGLDHNGKENYFSGLPTTNAAAWFVVLVSVYFGLQSFSLSIYYFFIPFFLIMSFLMIFSFKYNKNSIFTNMLYVLVPAALVVIWLFA